MVLANYVQSFENGEITGYTQPAGRITILIETSAEPVEPPVGPEEPTAPEESTIYVVVKGDSLWKIAKNKMGSGSLWNELFEANRDTIKDPNRIFIGQQLVIPGK